MTSSETPTRFDIEMQQAVHLTSHETGLMKDEQAMAWLHVGHIVSEQRYDRDVFTAWAGEQPTEPPFGLYRLLERSPYGSCVVTEFEIKETRERVIERRDPGVEKYAATIHEISEALGRPA